MADWTWTDDEVAAQAAAAHAAAANDTEPRALTARFDRESGQFVIGLNSGATFIFPARLAQGLADASPDLLAEIELSPEGYGLHWETLDVDFSIAGLLQGNFGNKTWMANVRAELARQAKPSSPSAKTSKKARRA